MAKSKTKRDKKKSVAEGNVYIQATFNNTIITITDRMGNALSWASAGSLGFKGAKKSTPYAAQMTAEAAVTRAKEYGLVEVHGAITAGDRLIVRGGERVQPGQRVQGPSLAAVDRRVPRAEDQG